LFGSRKGAFSGSMDSPGYLLSAHRGTLFLDEVGELSLHVQGKLLRALESREVLPLGATSPRAVDFRLCLATNRDLRGAVVRGAFREDLYFRTCRPSVTIPPLRERVEEIPWLVESMLASLPEPRAAHFSLVEACMLRAWSGNVRELAVELRSAALRVGPGEEVTVNELDPDAGRLLAGATPGAIARLLTPREGVPVARALDPPPPPEPPRPPAPPRATDATTPPRRPESARSHAYRNRERIIAALREARGNVTEAARRLDIPRTQLRRWIAKLKLDPKQYR
ncbi:MAG: sigma 54-interacting transcriptional regulator, partial [Myxococcales bacterium]|nr:sigma 54-interacting transcriptional regulator [Myxococcales bacterium]